MRMAFTGAGRMAESKRRRLLCERCWRSIRQNKLIEPVTNWLVKNRRGAQWSNTRDTAIAVLTLNDYLRTSGELQPVLGYELLVNGSPIATRQITADDALSAPTRFAIPRELIRDGQNEVTIRAQEWHWPTLLLGGSGVLQSRRAVEAGG